MKSIALASLLVGTAYAAFNATGISDEPFPIAGTLPRDFIWGATTGAFHSEGAWNEDGKSPSVWDTFSQSNGRKPGNTAADSYHQWKQDVDALEQMGAQSYRFSIAWSRIIPSGRDRGDVNEKGMAFYDNLINALVAKNITPYVVLYHWDHPEEIQKAYKGVLSKEDFKRDFLYYADKVFERFSDRVKYWVTFNDPRSVCEIGHGKGYHAPGRCSDRSRCQEGDSDTEPWVCGHTILVTHAATVQLYREKYAAKLNGSISMVIATNWGAPYSESDKAAAERYMEFVIGWFADPIYSANNDYPASMREAIKERLPTFTDDEKTALKNCIQDHTYFAMSHWNTEWVKEAPEGDPAKNKPGRFATRVIGPDNRVIGFASGASWMHIVPWGLRNALNWVSQRYNKPEIHILEQGIPVPQESELTLPEIIHDTYRSDMLKMSVTEIAKAIKLDSVNDGFDWLEGFAIRFGLVHVDEKTFKRTLKESGPIMRDFYKSARQQ